MLRDLWGKHRSSSNQAHLPLAKHRTDNLALSLRWLRKQVQHFDESTRNRRNETRSSDIMRQSITKHGRQTLRYDVSVVCRSVSFHHCWNSKDGTWMLLAKRPNWQRLPRKGTPDREPFTRRAKVRLEHIHKAIKQAFSFFRLRYTTPSLN